MTNIIVNPNAYALVEKEYVETDTEGLPVCGHCGQTCKMIDEIEAKCLSCGTLHRHDPDFDLMLPIF